MVKREWWAVGGLGVVATVVGVWSWTSGVSGAMLRPYTDARSSPQPTIPLIALDRLTQVASPAPVLGHRNIFDYATPPPPPPPPPTLAPPPTTTLAPVITVPTPPPLPPLNITFIAVVQNDRGEKVAVFANDRKEILAGETGETVANRFKVVKIGLESVDIQEVGSERSRRLPLKGN